MSGIKPILNLLRILVNHRLTIEESSVYKLATRCDFKIFSIIPKAEICTMNLLGDDPQLLIQTFQHHLINQVLTVSVFKACESLKFHLCSSYTIQFQILYCSQS